MHAHSDTAPGLTCELYPNNCPSFHGYVSDFTSHRRFQQQRCGQTL